jgi:uncharacterized RDD family membrane protein YckC
MGYANFFRRAGAFIIDGVILFVFFFIVGFLMRNAQMETRSFSMFGFVVINWLYFALMESSVEQATIGKRVLSIKVTDLEGNRITFWDATKRYLGKILSSVLYGIGFIIAAFTEKKQALHDKIASTLVVMKATDASFFAAQSTKHIKSGADRKLEQLSALKDQGVLNEAEFNEAREKLLALGGAK